MSKTTNKHQMQHLLGLMQKNPGIARGFFKGERQELQRFWQTAENELNALGPPNKNINEWKKVWTDQKKYVRQKAAQNLQQQKCTGGGPNREYKFSATEQAIFDLVAMKTSVEGVSVQSFGLGSPKNVDLSETIETDVEMPTVPEKENLDCAENSNGNGTPKLPTRRRDNISKESAADVLLAELAVQKDLVETVKKAVVDVKDQTNCIKKIYRSLDKMHDLQKKHFKAMENLKKEEIQEMRRHHSFMEKMRAKEME